MKKLTISLFLLAGVCSQTLVHAQNKTTMSQTKENGLDLSAMDKSVRPQDDFYNYVNGSWMKTAKIPQTSQLGEVLTNLLKTQITTR